MDLIWISVMKLYTSVKYPAWAIVYETKLLYFGVTNQEVRFGC